MDECRYIYDMVPMVDMILGTVDDIQTQLLYRFVLDALDKYLFYYNREWFDGNAVISITTKEFEAKEFSKRVWI